VIDPIATPLRKWIFRHHEGNVTHAAKALGYSCSTMHRVMNSAYVIDGIMYTSKRKAK
jgi:DNA-binding protein Fis